MEEFETAKPSMEQPFVVLSGNEVVYSNLVEISEDDLPEDVVDLGLSVKWASCNIGADSPCEPGLLFQFGRVDGYAYGDTNHQFSIANPPVTTSGKTYNTRGVLDPEDDAAYVSTNGMLRMPTNEEIDELLAGTTNEWCQCTELGEDHASHVVYGRLFTSKINGNKIFIPAAGYFYGTSNSFDRAGSSGNVWSASVYYDDAKYAHNLAFYSGGCSSNFRDRYVGLSVRGVCA